MRKMGQYRKNPSMTYRSIKSYYRRWFMCLAMSPAYVYFHHCKDLTVKNRFNTTATFLSINQVLKVGFDAWWIENRVNVQTPLFLEQGPTMETFTVPMLYSDDEVFRELSKHLQKNRTLIDEDDYIDNLTITDNRRDHQEREIIDRLLGAALIRFIKKSINLGATCPTDNYYRKLKQAAIADLLDPKYYSGKSTDKDINKKNVYVNDQLKLFDRVARNAMFGYFYSAETSPLLPNDELLWKNGLRSSFASYKDSADFFSLQYIANVISALAPSTLLPGETDPRERLPDPRITPFYDERDTFIVFPDARDDFIDTSNSYWRRVKPYLHELFFDAITPRKKAASAIAAIILDETSKDSTPQSIERSFLELIAALIPYLYREDDRSGSLDKLWIERPGLFVETTNSRFGKTILLKKST